MKKINYFLYAVLIIALVVPVTVAYAEDNGVDDLRGRWDIEWSFFDPGGEPGGTFPPLILYVNEMRESMSLPGTFYAGGCMRSPDTDVFTPLSIRATYDLASNTYDAIIYSTVVPFEEEEEPFVIRLMGTIFINGSGVNDDAAGGELRTGFADGEWAGVHHDRRKTQCPTVFGQGFGAQGDVYAHRDLGYPSPRTYTLYEMHTVIVSSGLLVQAPDGSTTIVQEYTDIFSPDVDFIGRFRYLKLFGGTPDVGGTYRFVLLDIFGEPIPGTESTDVWMACNQGAPANLQTIYGPGTDVLLEWDPVADVGGEFEPGNEPQVGFYQIGIGPFNWESPTSFGSNLVKSASHYIPWSPFEPGTPGAPDGDNYGVALSEFADGIYTVDVSAFSEADPQNGGLGLECAAYDSTERLVIHKDGNMISTETIATISGKVADGDGNPLSGIEVGACEYQDEGICYGEQTGEDGRYLLTLLSGSYRVSAGGEGWVNLFYDNTMDWALAAEVVASAGQDTAGVDFTMVPGGSISGFVYDADGTPLANIAVDTETGGFGTCTDESGYYNLQGIPFGTYNVVAGRDFCDPHPFAEQTRFDVAVGSAGVNFTLQPAEEYQPALHVVPAHPEIHGHGWNPDASVTIYVDNDDDLGNGILYMESKLVNDEPTWCVAPCFDVSQAPELPGGIQPGYVVTMMDGEATRVVHVTSLSWTGTDMDADTVFGSADPLAWIEVSVHGPEWGQRVVQADANGDWVADFSMPGPEDFEQDVLDLAPGYHGRAIEFEGGVPDDGTLAYWNVEEPPQPEYGIVAQPDHEWVYSHGWNVGVAITMYIDDNADHLDGYHLSMSQTAKAADWDPTIGQVNFDNWAPFDLIPGMFVIVTDGSVVETLQVESFSVDQWDGSNLTVTGSAPAGREVGVGLHQPDGDFWLVALSNANGEWTADFSAEGVDAPNVFDIHAMIWDEDGDATQANYDFP